MLLPLAARQKCSHCRDVKEPDICSWNELSDCSTVTSVMSADYITSTNINTIMKKCNKEKLCFSPIMFRTVSVFNFLFPHFIKSFRLPMDHEQSNKEIKEDVYSEARVLFAI